MELAIVDTDKLLTPTEAAIVIGVTTRRVQTLCKDKRLGLKIGNRYFIEKTEARKFRPNPPGRPPSK